LNLEILREGATPTTGKGAPAKVEAPEAEEVEASSGLKLNKQTQKSPSLLDRGFLHCCCWLNALSQWVLGLPFQLARVFL
jgi:hypothetical protein